MPNNEITCALVVDNDDYKRMTSDPKYNLRGFRKILTFQYIPHEITKSLGGTYAQIQIPGAAIPVQQFIANNPYQIRMNLIFNTLGEDITNFDTQNQREDFIDNTYVKDRVDWLFTFCSSQGGNQGQTMRLKLFWGESRFIYDGSNPNAITKGFDCILKSVTVKETQFDHNNFFPLRASCDIVLESIRKFPQLKFR